MKPIKYGIKSYILCDSTTAYCYHIKPYCAESLTLIQTVTILMSDLKNKGYHLYMDNFYNSMKMSTAMLEIGTHTCGTMRRNRGEPEETDVTIGQLQPQQRIVRNNGKMIITSWRDRKLVKIISTHHHDGLRQVRERPKGGAEKLPKDRPVAVCDYNKYMKGKETNQTLFV